MLPALSSYQANFSKPATTNSAHTIADSCCCCCCCCQYICWIANSNLLLLLPTHLLDSKLLHLLDWHLLEHICWMSNPVICSAVIPPVEGGTPCTWWFPGRGQLLQ